MPEPVHSAATSPLRRAHRAVQSAWTRLWAPRANEALAAVFEHAFDAIVCKNLNGRITHWNPAASRLFGHSASEAVGAHIALLIPESHRAEEAGILAAILRGEVVTPYETQRRHSSGRLLDVSITVSPIRDGQGRVIGASKIARDISAIQAVRRADQALRDLHAEHQRLSDSLQAQALFVAHVSHELKTPLNAVMGFSELLTLPGAHLAPEQQRHYAERIQHSGRHLLAMINDVLDIARIDAGRLRLHAETFAPAELLSELVQLMEAHARRRGHSFSLDLADAPATLASDPKCFRQMGLNLLSNALKYADRDTRIRVRCFTNPAAGAMEVHVVDAGPGIAADDAATLFVAFSRLKGARAAAEEGSGLGLALTKRMAESLGGQVGLRSAPGQGSDFWFSLPLVPPVFEAPPVVSGESSPMR